MSDNPFERFALPPTSTPEEITETLRERMEEARPEQRAELRAVWEKLMLHARDRVVLAIGAHPRSGPAAARPPAPPDASWVSRAAVVDPPPDDLVPLPSLGALVRAATRKEPGPERTALDRLLADPILRPEGSR